jgi:hypothetical protein
MLLLLTLVAAICILAWVPPVSRDALVHHLAIPKLWLKQGGIYEMPDMVISYYPMNLDLLYMIPLYLGNDIIPKLIHFAFALGTAWLIFTYLAKRLDKYYAFLGGIFFLTTPVIVKLSITAYVDLGLIFFSTAGLLQLLRWHDNLPGIKQLVMAAFCCGLAMGTKYNGLIVFVLMTILVLLLGSPGMSKNRPTLVRTLFYSVLFMIIAGLVYSPWGIKNTIWTGNPFYPLFDNWFNPSNPFEAPSIPPLVLRKFLYHESWWEIMLVPVRIFFEGQDDAHRYFDGKLNPALLILPLFSFFASNRNGDKLSEKNEKLIFAGFAILFILLVFFRTNMRVRYIGPAIPGLVILSIFGIKNVFGLIDRYAAGSIGNVIRGLSLITVLVFFSFNAIYILEQFRIVTPFQYASGKLSRDQYIEKFRPEYASIHHANTFLSPDARILSLFIGKRGYYSDRAMSFDINILKTAIRNAASPAEIHSNLIDIGFTHLLIRFDMFDNWCNHNLDQKEKQMVIDLMSFRDSLLIEKNGHGLYKLLSLSP